MVMTNYVDICICVVLQGISDAAANDSRTLGQPEDKVEVPTRSVDEDDLKQWDARWQKRFKDKQ